MFIGNKVTDNPELTVATICKIPWRIINYLPNKKFDTKADQVFRIKILVEQSLICLK